MPVRGASRPRNGARNKAAQLSKMQYPPSQSASLLLAMSCLRGATTSAWGTNPPIHPTLLKIASRCIAGFVKMASSAGRCSFPRIPRRGKLLFSASRSGHSRACSTRFPMSGQQGQWNPPTDCDTRYFHFAGQAPALRMRDECRGHTRRRT